MKDIPVALIVALIGTGGAGLFIREIVDVVLKVVLGISAKESKRKLDLVSRAEEAEDRADFADARADVAVRNQGTLREYAQGLRLDLMEAGGRTRESLKPWPELEPYPTPPADKRA